MNPYMIIAGLVAAISLFFGGVHTGKKLERTDWQAATIKARMAATAQHNADVAANEKLRSDYAAQTKLNGEKHANEIDSANARYAALAGKRVPVSPHFCGVPAAAHPSQTSSAGVVIQDPAPAHFLPEPFTGNLRQLARASDEQLADFRQLVQAVKEAKCFEGF